MPSYCGLIAALSCHMKPMPLLFETFLPLLKVYNKKLNTKHAYQKQSDKGNASDTPQYGMMDLIFTYEKVHFIGLQNSAQWDVT